jgi:hypothetical protein
MKALLEINGFTRIVEIDGYRDVVRVLAPD